MIAAGDDGGGQVNRPNIRLAAAAARGPQVSFRFQRRHRRLPLLLPRPPQQPPPPPLPHCGAPNWGGDTGDGGGLLRRLLRGEGDDDG